MDLGPLSLGPAASCRLLVLAVIVEGRRHNSSKIESNTKTREISAPSQHPWSKELLQVDSTKLKRPPFPLRAGRVGCTPLVFPLSDVGTVTRGQDMAPEGMARHAKRQKTPGCGGGDAFTFSF